MNRGEPVVHDVDLVDARIMDETSEVDWQRVSEGEAASFGLSLGLFRDAVHVNQQRRVAWGTATGGVITMSVLVALCMLTGSSGWFAAGLILIHQGLRTAWLFWKVKQSEKDLQAMQEQAIDCARQIAERHPAGLGMGGGTTPSTR